jgi:putative endonuclease
MTLTRKQLGDRGEAIAAGMLEREGFTIVDRNWRFRGGEIDLVAVRGDLCVFVEVRARRTTTLGTAVESITARKRAHLLDAIAAYEVAHPDLPDGRRVDLVTLDREGGRLVVRRIENAIEGD